MRYILFLTFLSVFSCNNERVLQLPEIENAEVTEVLDVSPAYIFYDETQPDSTLLNRKNLISTTNWLVNVDKRLTLRQAIPHIKYIQDKKRNAEVHKNENAKNYFTCNDTSIENLGFLEFTDVYYEINTLPKIDEEFITSTDTTVIQKLQNKEYYSQWFGTDTYFTLSIFVNRNKSVFYYEGDLIEDGGIISITDQLSTIIDERHISGLNLQVWYHKDLSFQDYISLKAELSKLNKDKMIIDPYEFIY